jgi:predicted nucleic acid-binding protein
MTCLPDVSVWIALALSAARPPSGRQSLVYGIHRRRLLSNPRVMAGEALTAGQAWKVLEAFLADPRIEFAGEPARLYEYWRRTASDSRTGPNFWTDSYLAAFAAAAGYQVVTFDSGFRRYKGVPLNLLS